MSSSPPYPPQRSSQQKQEGQGKRTRDENDSMQPQSRQRSMGLLEQVLSMTASAVATTAAAIQGRPEAIVVHSQSQGSVALQPSSLVSDLTQASNTLSNSAVTQSRGTVLLEVFSNDEIMTSIFSYLPIKEQGRNKLVCKRWETLNTQSIEQSPKKAFETTKELRIAVLAYCNQGGYLNYYNGRRGWVSPPTRSQRQMVSHVYGAAINDWNVSEIEIFDTVFADCQSFDDIISSWNTSNAKSMLSMFSGASSFNQPLNGWNTSNVSNMAFMLDRASSFNQPLNGWNTSKVRAMIGMFSGASSFDQPLNEWNTSNVETMVGMLEGAIAFNRPLNGWNTSKVKDMAYMFDGASSFNQPLDRWDTSKVKDMKQMFHRASSFDQPLNGWDTSNVENMAYMFDGASSFNHPIDMWDTSSITDPRNMPLV